MKKEAGFTLLECILAVMILTTVLGSIIGVQSSVISVTQVGANKMRASWAIRSALSQVEYLIQLKGQAFIPEKSSYKWSADKRFQLSIQRIDLKNIKPSQFLTSAIKIYNQTDPTGNKNLNVEEMLAPVIGLMDAAYNPSSTNTLQAQSSGLSTQNSISAQSGFSDILIKVTWPENGHTMTLEEGFMLIDDNVLSSFSPPSEAKSGDKSP